MIPERTGVRTACLPLIVLGLLVFEVQADPVPAKPILQMETASGLVMLKKAYLANNHDSDLFLEGRVFYTQHAPEGKETPAESRDDPDWLTFRFLKKGSKWRYEQQFSLDPRKKLTRINDGTLFFASDHANQLNIYPNEESLRSQLLNVYGRFLVVDFGKSDRFYDLPSTIDTLGLYLANPEKKEDGFNVELQRDRDVFVLKWGYSPDLRNEVHIDSSKGYNFVKSFYTRRDGLGNVATSETVVDYREIEPGVWVPVSGRLAGISNSGIEFEAKLEVASASAKDFAWSPSDFCLPPGVPAIGAEVVDYSFDPPLKFRKGEGALTDDILSKFLDKPLRSAQFSPAENAPIEARTSSGKASPVASFARLSLPQWALVLFLPTALLVYVTCRSILKKLKP